MSPNYCIKLKNKPKDLTKHYYNCEIITDCYNLLVNRHRNLFLKLEQLELENKARATRVLRTALLTHSLVVADVYVHCRSMVVQLLSLPVCLCTTIV